MPFIKSRSLVAGVLQATTASTRRVSTSASACTSVGSRRNHRRPLPLTWRRPHSTARTSSTPFLPLPLAAATRTRTRTRTHTGTTIPAQVRIRAFSFISDDEVLAPPPPTLSAAQWNDQVRNYLEAAESGNGSSSKAVGQQLHQAYQLLDHLLFLSSQDHNNTVAAVDDANEGKEEEEEESSKDASIKTSNGADIDTTRTQVLVDASLALQLLDSVVERQEGLQDFEESIEWTKPSHNVLNIILQLWRTSITGIAAKEASSASSPSSSSSSSSLPSPNQMLTKLDEFRLTTASIVLPDVHSYNILLAAAGALGKIDLCRQVYDWMWTERLVDDLIQPDRVTLRAMFRALLQSKTISTTEAAEECERLVDHYFSQQSTMNTRDVAAIYQSLIHVWAMADPWQAQSYLQDMAQRHMDHLTDVELSSSTSTRHPPPDTMAWNRVISAWSIQHGQPDEGMALLNDFWSFSQTLQDLKRHEREQAAEQSLILSNPHTEQQGQLREQTTSTGSSSTGIPQPDLYSYNAILEGWARLGNATEANKVYQLLLQREDATLSSRSNSVRPNIVTYSSAIKANGGDLDRVHQIAQDCLQAHQKQQKEQEEMSQDTGRNRLLELDRPFFHAWLQACVMAATTQGDAAATAAAVTTAETVLLEIMPTVGTQPTHNSFGYLLECYVRQDDLEGATHWLLKHVEELDERTIVAWTLQLTDMGEIELVSFMDRFWGSNHPPKTLLQVLVQGEHLQSPEALEQVLSKLSASQRLQVLQWIPVENRMPPFFALVLRALAQEGDGTGAEELWNIAHEDWRQKHNRMVQDSPSSMDPTMMGDMYTSLIVAWSKGGDLERTRHWWDTWINDTDMVPVAPPSRTAQTAVLACLAAAFQPNQAQSFWEELFVLHQTGQIPEAPDRVMFNLVLKAWMLAPSGLRAQRFLEMAQQRYGVVPDEISYNSIVQAYAKERKLEQAMVFVRAFVKESRTVKDDGNVADFPNLATFRSILKGWSLHRQDYTLATKEATSIFRWMTDLYSQGILKEDPKEDRSTQALIAECQKRQRRHQSGHRSRQSTR